MKYIKIHLDEPRNAGIAAQLAAIKAKFPAFSLTHIVREAVRFYYEKNVKGK